MELTLDNALARVQLIERLGRLRVPMPMEKPVECAPLLVLWFTF